MRSSHLLHRLLTIGTLLALPLPANASGLDISNIFVNLIFSFAPLWGFIALIVIVVAGFTLMVSQDEGAIDKAKKTVVGVVIGGIITTIILLFAGDPRVLIFQFFSPFFNPGATTFVNTGNVLGAEAEGVSDWFTSMAAMIGIVIVIIAVLKAVTSFGGDEAAYTNARNAILQVIIGLIVIGGAYLLKTVFFFTGEPSPLIGYIIGKILIIFAIITTIALAILIYAGFRMVVSFGREEDYTAAKSLAIRVVVGLMVIALSFSVVWIVGHIF